MRFLYQHDWKLEFIISQGQGSSVNAFIRKPPSRRVYLGKTSMNAESLDQALTLLCEEIEVEQAELNRQNSIEAAKAKAWLQQQKALGNYGG